MSAAISVPAQVPRQHSVDELVAMAKSLYPQGPLLRRKMQQLRPYICPFDILLSVAPETGSLLDVGCGSGLFLGLALASGKNISATGIDFSEPALRLAGEMRQIGLNTSQRARLTFRQVRGTADWPSQTFDMVSLVDVMHHVPSAERRPLFNALAAHVKPGGILLYKDIAPRPIWRALLNRLHDLIVAHDWIRYHPVAQVEAAAEHAGFIKLRSETIYRLWYAHELRVFRKKPAP